MHLHFQEASWTKLETDHLVAMALKYDLRWPVIKDRYKCTPDRPVQELQQRFYDVANRLQVASHTVVHHSVLCLLVWALYPRVELRCPWDLQ